MPSPSLLTCPRILPVLPTYPTDWADPAPMVSTRAPHVLRIPEPAAAALPETGAIVVQPHSAVASSIRGTPFDDMPPLVIPLSTISARYPPGYGPDRATKA